MSHNVLIFFNRMVLYHILTDKQGYHKNKLGDCGLYFNSKEVSTRFYFGTIRGVFHQVSNRKSLLILISLTSFTDGLGPLLSLTRLSAALWQVYCQA